ncbi:hypothetical protein [Thermoflexus sp.]|uniref:hypothetical protein n=1 Tax=Thermoflexus sp. TaxID=1969742 RepID=UPI0035E411B4
MGWLAEPISLMAVPGVALIYWLRQAPPERRRSALPLAGAVLLAMAIVSPWTVRNYLVFKRSVPLKASFGLNFG